MSKLIIGYSFSISFESKHIKVQDLPDLIADFCVLGNSVWRKNSLIVCSSVAIADAYFGRWVSLILNCWFMSVDEEAHSLCWTKAKQFSRCFLTILYHFFLQLYGRSWMTGDKVAELTRSQVDDGDDFVDDGEKSYALPEPTKFGH